MSEYDVHGQPESGLRDYGTVGIIGKNGQIGGMLRERLGEAGVPALFVAGRGEIPRLMAEAPELVVVATPNPVQEVLEQLATEAVGPTTVLLTQNGIGVVEQAAPIVAGTEIAVVRGGIFTVVSRDSGDALRYAPERLRLALAPGIGATQTMLARIGHLMELAGFAIRYYPDYRSLEWTKLVANCLGSTSAVTGLSPQETFSDPELFAWELWGLRDRLAILREQGIPWVKTNVLQLGARLLSDHQFPAVRRSIAKVIAKGRDNQPAAAARKIATGQDIAEALEYHRPFLSGSAVDRAIYTLLSEHTQGIRNLTLATVAERRSWLREKMPKQYTSVYQRPG